jgi:MFS transporter, FHS family, Na+ dependent glucose transporter 1
MAFSSSQPVTPAQVTQRRLQQTFAYYLAFIILGLTTASLGPTLQGLAGNLGAALSLMSSLFPVRSLGYLLGSLLGGRLYDRFPAHPMIAAGLVLMAVMMALVPVLSIFVLLGGVFLLVGICEGFIDVGGNTLIVWVHGDAVGPFMNALHFFFGVGAFISPLIVAQVILFSGGVNWAYWILAILNLPVAAWLIRQPNLGLQVHTRGVTSLREPADTVLVSIITVFFFLYVAGEVSMGGWAYSYATAMNLGDQVTSAYLTSAFWGAITVGRLASIAVAARLRSAQILLIDLVGSMLSLAIILIFPASKLALWVGVIGAGLFMASMFPTMLAFAGQRMAITGKVTGLFLVGASLGGMSAPWIIGQLFEPVGPRVVMFAITLSIALAFLSFGLVMRRSQKAR